MDVAQASTQRVGQWEILPGGSRRARRENVLSRRGDGGADQPRGRSVNIPPPQWATSALDYRTHVLSAEGRDPLGPVVALCGHRLLCDTPHTDEPQIGRCGSCEFMRRHPDAVWPDPGRFPAIVPLP